TQEVNVALGKTEHVRGQGIIRLSDNAALTGVTQSFNNVKFSNTSVNKQYSGLIVSYQTNETSTLTIENSEFTNSTVGGRGAITLNQGGTEYRGNTTIRFSTFSDLNPVVSRNTAGYLGGAIYSNENYGKLTINNNTFTNCGIKEADIDYIKALKGGAIYIGECTKTGIKDSNENVIDITENTFTNCIADQGGAIYMKDVPDTNIIDAEFRRNKANMGSAVYHENTTTDRRQGNVKVTRPVFVENGLPVNTTGTYSSKGTYYVKLPTETRTTNVTFEDFYAVQNKGATSVMYVDKLYTDTPKAESVIPTSRMNVVKFTGETIIRENIGGPVLSANNSAQSENNGYIQFTDETLIQNNTTGTTYAVTAARNCAINVQFAGIATVSNNKATNGSDANIYLSERIQTNIVKNMLLDGPRSLLYFSTDIDRPICEWEDTTIAGFDTPGLFLEDHLKTDNEASSLFLIYKTDERPFTVYIGQRTDIVEIRGYLTSTISTANRMLAKLNARNVYMDNFTTPSDAEFADLYSKCPEYRDYKFGGWIIKNSNDEYERLEYGKTKISVDGTITLDAYWTTTNHSHKSCGCAKGSTTCTHGTPDNETWIVAFRESV
ncbi:MAG: hypothetical protein IJ593_01630, partial [Lachnospiraceae bacterium]|nr:hypothetical protein [Lachnospiraceae bacterium]